jgi:hypothetical protein
MTTARWPLLGTRVLLLVLLLLGALLVLEVMMLVWMCVAASRVATGA